MVLIQVKVIILLMQKRQEDLPEIWKELYSVRRIRKRQEFLYRISVP